MTMKTKISILLLSFLFSASGVFAHALWIETTSTGKKGQSQEVKVFFGEYEAGERDSIQKWFSNLKEFSLVLTAPNGTTKKLNATADVLFFKAVFTPEQDGLYKLSIVHEVKDLYEKAKIEYYAFADVAVGRSAKVGTPFPAEALLSIRLGKPVLKVGEAASHEVLYKQAPAAKQKLTIIGADGKKQEIETDPAGKFTFTPAQKGGHFLESFTEEKTSGSLNGKDYEKIWHVVTYFAQAI